MLGPRSFRNLDKLNKKLEKQCSDLRRMQDLKEYLGAGSYIRDCEYRKPLPNSLYLSEKAQWRAQVEPPNLSHLYGGPPPLPPSQLARKLSEARDSDATLVCEDDVDEIEDSPAFKKYKDIIDRNITPPSDEDYTSKPENPLASDNDVADLLRIIEVQIGRINRPSSPTSTYCPDGNPFGECYAADDEEDDEYKKGTSILGWYPTAVEIETYHRGPNDHTYNTAPSGTGGDGRDSPESWENFADSDEDVVDPGSQQDGISSNPEGSDDPESERDDDYDSDYVSESESESESASASEEDSEEDSDGEEEQQSGSGINPFDDPPIIEVGARHRVSITTAHSMDIASPQTAILEHAGSQSQKKKCHSSRLKRAYERHVQKRRARKAAKAAKKQADAEKKKKKKDRNLQEKKQKTHGFLGELRSELQRRYSDGRESQDPFADNAPFL